MEFDAEELADALRQALTDGQADDPHGGVTMHELTRLTGRHDNYIRRGLRQLKDQGRLQVVMVRSERIDGARCSIPAYRLISPDDTNGTANDNGE